MNRYRLAALLCLALPIAAPLSGAAASAKTGRAERKASIARLQWPRFARSADNDYFAIGWLQQLLNSRGAKLKVDHVFGAQTEAAVKTFQRAHGLTADGVVGPRTWAKLIVRLKRGDKNNAVRVVQGIFGYFASEGGAAEYDVEGDGVFGARTEKAVRHFQKESGLLVDGVVGPRTWCVLFGGKVIG
jgi:murein L,D-transpeptidase YcbB/YkuD